MKANELVPGHYYLYKSGDSLLIFQVGSYYMLPGRCAFFAFPILFVLDSSFSSFQYKREASKLIDMDYDEFTEINSDTFLKVVKIHELSFNSIISLIQKYLIKDESK